MFTGESYPYSQSATISAVRDYYEFLTHLYLDENKIIEPPEEGWPSITIEKFKPLGKTDEVVELLRHLPYIHCEETEGAPRTKFADWQESGRHLSPEDDGEGLRICSEGPEVMDSVPPYVVGLTLGGRGTEVMLLNVKDGTVHWYDCPMDTYKYFHPGESKDEDEQSAKDSALDDGIVECESDGDTSESNDDGSENSSKSSRKQDEYGQGSDQEVTENEEYESEGEVPWRDWSHDWDIESFFDFLKHQFLVLNWIPLNSTSIMAIYHRSYPPNDGLVAALQQAYHDHGWPDLEKYRKKECLEVVQRLVQEHDDLQSRERKEEQERWLSQRREKENEEKDSIHIE